MNVVDLMALEGRVFLKSEWGPIDDGWPCISFTKRSVGEKLRREFKVGRDVLVYVGTTSETTRDPAHRSRLLSVVVPEPSHILETRKIVPSDVWEAAVEEFGIRWPHSMAVVTAAQILEPLPHAHEIIPEAYRKFSEFEHRGSFVEALDDERQAVMELPVQKIELNLSPDVQKYINLKRGLGLDQDKRLQEEAYRLAVLIQQRVKSGGELSVKRNPMRTAPDLVSTVTLILNAHAAQSGKCALCKGGLRLDRNHPMLKMSVDRIDSDNGAYSLDNVHLTHLACNLAKNKYGLEEFWEWLGVIREGVE